MQALFVTSILFLCFCLYFYVLSSLVCKFCHSLGICLLSLDMATWPHGQWLGEDP